MGTPLSATASFPVNQTPAFDLKQIETFLRTRLDRVPEVLDAHIVNHYLLVEIYFESAFEEWLDLFCSAMMFLYRKHVASTFDLPIMRITYEWSSDGKWTRYIGPRSAVATVLRQQYMKQQGKLLEDYELMMKSLGSGKDSTIVESDTTELLR